MSEERKKVNFTSHLIDIESIDGWHVSEFFERIKEVSKREEFIGDPLFEYDYKCNLSARRSL